MSNQFQDDGLGTHPGTATESSFDLAVDAICDLVEGDSAGPPPDPVAAPAKEEEYPLHVAPPTADAAASVVQVDANITSTQAVSANCPLANKMPAEGEVYINKDGKKVKRVKRSEKRMMQKRQQTPDAAPEVEAASAQAAVPSHQPDLQPNQEAQNEAEAQRAAAAAASAALLGAEALAVRTSASFDLQAIPENASSANAEMRSSPFEQSPNSSDDDSNSSEDDGDDGDWDLDYKTGLAKQHEDAERQMLEGEEGRRGFDSTDDEDDYGNEDDYDEDETRTEEYTNPDTESAMDGISFSGGTAPQIGIAASSNSKSAEAEMPVEPKNPFDDEQVKVSDNPAANAPYAPLPPRPIEGPPSINQTTVAEDVALDPGDIRAALSSASGGHDMTESTLNQFDPLHVVAQESSAQLSAQGALLEMPAAAPPLQQGQLLSSTDNAASSHPERFQFEEATAAGQGPLWRQAGIMAAAAESQQQYHQLDPQQGKITKRAALEQTIRDECWSRAAVDTGEVAPDTLFRARSGEPTAVVHPDSERVATKRVNVVQLLINGLIGLVGGLFSSIYVQTGCHFVTVDVGLPLHFGLWQYSPMDSAFQGFSYCYPYDEDNTHDSPTFSRIFGLIALVAGAFSLSVLWVYLLLGRTSAGLWKWAVRFLVVAASFQALTYSFFAEDVCRRNSCSLGPGSIVSLISTLSWTLVAYEMRDNSPIATALIPDPHQEPGDATMNHHQQQGGMMMEMTGYRPPVNLGVNV